MRLDALADALEIKRLTGMHVLTDASARSRRVVV